MPRLNYALPEDVLRRFDPTTSAEDIDNDSITRQDDRETIVSRLEGVESKWEQQATPMRPIPVGSNSVPKYFRGRGSGPELSVYLDHRHIHPLDPDMGDEIAIRTGRDTWTSIIEREGTAFAADYEQGTLTVYTRPLGLSIPVGKRRRKRFAKVTYHLAAGGDYSRAGQTTISETLAEGDTPTIDVAHAERLPRSGGTMLLGGEEYVLVDEVDHGTGEVSIADRGLRRVGESSHDAGSVIHFCPMDVREAVAAKAARELVIFDDFTEWLRDGDIDRETRLGEWADEWDTTTSAYSETG